MDDEFELPEESYIDLQSNQNSEDLTEEHLLEVKLRKIENEVFLHPAESYVKDKPAPVVQAHIQVHACNRLIEIFREDSTPHSKF